MMIWRSLGIRPSVFLVVSILFGNVEHIASDFSHTRFIIFLVFFLNFPSFVGCLFPQIIQSLCIFSQFLQPSSPVFLVELELGFVFLLVHWVIWLYIAVFVLFGDAAKSVPDVIFEQFGLFEWFPRWTFWFLVVSWSWFFWGLWAASFSSVFVLVASAVAVFAVLAFMFFVSSFSAWWVGGRAGRSAGFSSSNAHLLPPFLQILGQILLFYFLDDVSHLKRVVDNGIFPCFFLLHNLEHGVFMQQLKIFAPAIGDLFLKDMFHLLFFARLGKFLPSEVLLIDLLLSNFIAPVVHPLHSVEMRPRNESGLNLNSFELIVMLFLE